MTELMSLEEINQYESPFPYSERFIRLLATARAAHQWKGYAEELDKIIANRNFAELMKINVLAELTKARQEERERCAQIADTYEISCADAIRAMKD